MYYELGYVSEEWVFDLYVWMREADIPGNHLDALRGLLFGYSPSAISRFFAREGDLSRLIHTQKKGVLTAEVDHGPSVLSVNDTHPGDTEPS